MSSVEIKMYKKKSTDYKDMFKDNMDRVGYIYLPMSTTERLKINNELIILIGPDKGSISDKEGYVTRLIKDKETPKKIRFKEDIQEGGELKVIYISKALLDSLSFTGNEIAVKISAPMTGGM